MGSSASAFSPEPRTESVDWVNPASFHVAPSFPKGFGGVGPGFIFLDSLAKGMHQSQKERVMAFRCFIDFSVDLLGNVVIRHHCRVILCFVHCLPWGEKPAPGP
uniref:Uncharacterized protein n=1 Tax=Candidatus Kentrum sp. UNK TaxID=2126344 RepID=A0A451ARC3_9GAMM|nr:MAG: hypothetical protein BECKUNK1418G_GA0071005_12474 [Candidatus Kentron sp. UNK]VFK73656.1 MAG: hypothetical protein BECKUNK1418H_GA0071006_12424 [Candidatus Kentron sp. UNK]